MTSVNPPTPKESAAAINSAAGDVLSESKVAAVSYTHLSFKLVNVAHRHCVFTIDENLRDFFLHDLSLIHIYLPRSICSGWNE